MLRSSARLAGKTFSLVAVSTRKSLLQRRQQIGLVLLGAWAALVVLVTILTHRLGVMGWLGLSTVLALPFRKRTRR